MDNAGNEKRFWADSLANGLDAGKRQVVSDAKTPSGPIHVGALRGVVIHDLVFKALVDAGREAEFTYRFDDFDPMDGFPKGLDESFMKHMGKPLCSIPSPEKGFDSYARCYAEQFIAAFERIGCKPKVFWSSENYRKGGMDAAIRTALEKAAEINEINERVSGTKKQGDWLPINVVCEKCGQIGGTVASGFDGETVGYECRDTKYSKGCSYKGNTPPFGGKAKLTWKADWAATFKVLGVTLEGAGKDHYAAGGSRAVANELCEKVFNYPHPYDLPYEHFLLAGKKMSSSKGIGVGIKEISELLPPEILRFLMTRFKPRTAIDFNPAGESVPRLFDDYDAFAESHAGHRQPRDPDEPMIYAISQTTGEARKNPPSYYHANFSLVAQLVQVPHINVKETIEKRKGSALTPLEESELDVRAAAAKKWLENYAGEDDKLTILGHAEAVKNFSALPPKYQEALHEFGEHFETAASEDEQAAKIKEIALKHGMTVKEFFESSYTILTGRKTGPKLLAFLNALEKQFVAGRFKGLH
ncbi:MAG: lysine--tRNA ligase [Candidatus Micrarchaeota archaeon]